MVDQPQLTIGAVGAVGPLQDAQRALLTRLAYGFPDKQFFYSAIPAQMTPATWKRVGQRSPFVAVGFWGIKPKDPMPQRYAGRATWEVYIGLANPRPDSLLNGDARTPGLLGLGSVAIAVLHGQTDKGVGTWECGQVKNIYDERWAEDAYAVVGIEVSMELQITDPAAAAALPDFQRYSSTLSWGLPDLTAAPDGVALTTAFGESL